MRNSRGTLAIILDRLSRTDTHPPDQRQEGWKIHQTEGGGHPSGDPDPVRAQRPLPRKHPRQPRRQPPLPSRQSIMLRRLTDTNAVRHHRIPHSPT